ncbi:G patch domain-containing protein 11-like [Liolophura sinensis]|uniref:G patch domain-containing protein 11-like n=1 Tax=Liolophura sinensis TaxID=3198878 RepID=UPI003159239A
MDDSSGEDDYMSDAILKQCQDVRPGLLSSKSSREKQREHIHQEKNRKNVTKPRNVLEREKREEGLASAMSSENKGFALLQKMGYKPGMAIGKKGEGRVEPIPVIVKTNRSGLGQEAHQKRKQEMQAMMRISMAAKRRKMEEQHKGDFVERKSKQFSEKLAERDLYKSQKVCEQLDSQKGIEEPGELFFWPEACLPGSDRVTQEDDTCEDKAGDQDTGYRLTAFDPFEISEEETDQELDHMPPPDLKDLTTQDKLEILTLYLRRKHLYCVWCATTFDDKADLEENCPGSTSEAHS